MRQECQDIKRKTKAYILLLLPINHDAKYSTASPCNAVSPCVGEIFPSSYVFRHHGVGGSGVDKAVALFSVRSQTHREAR